MTEEKKLELNLPDLIWVLEFTGEAEENDDDGDCVVRAAKRLIGSVMEQLTDDEVSELDKCLELGRSLRFAKFIHMV